jgi:hypothetical protein
MTEHISMNAVHELAERAHRAEKKIENAREKATEIMGQTLQLVEVAGAAFAFGYAHQRYGTNGELLVAGVPADLAAGLGLHAFSLLGGFSKYSEHGHNLADGCLAAYGFRMGSQMGAQALAGGTGTAKTTAGWYVPGGAAQSSYVNHFAG